MVQITPTTLILTLVETTRVKVERRYRGGKPEPLDALTKQKLVVFPGVLRVCFCVVCVCLCG